ncbi:MAG TPA: hypothetical protein VEA16_19625 [Vicinamibacterales bacterium]|nr:hypothetical protein [Vicinamibacterales bacterium]
MKLVHALALSIVPALASAQSSPSLRPGHVTISAGVAVSGPYGVGDATAELRSNRPGPAPPPFTLFRADSRVTRATSPEFRVGLALSRRLAIEAGASLSRPRITVAIADDLEAPAQQLAGERLQQYLFDAALTWQLPIRVGGRLAPFVAAGGGYLRQLHEDRMLAETGELYFAGAGARYWLRGRSGSSMALGFRGDVRANVRRNGIDFANKERVFPSLSVSVFLGL